jgi:hypothetical protein
VEEQAKFEEWAVVEVLGHLTYAGRVTAQNVGGCSFIRIEVPALDTTDRGDRPAFTKLFGQSAIYSITPVEEHVALAAARHLDSRPLSLYIPELEPPMKRFRPLIADDEPEFGDPFEEI